MKNKTERMCAFCRSVKEKSELFRVVRTGGRNEKSENEKNEVALDLSFKAQGRGAYVCRDLKCIDGAEKRRSLERSLSHKIDEKIYGEMRNFLDSSE